MKKFRKGLAVLLCISLAVVSGCGGKNNGETGGQAGTGQTDAKQTGTTQAAQSGGQEKQEITLTVFSQQSVSSESGIWQGWGAKRLYDDLNIKLDFYPTGNEVEQKLNQYLAGGSLPDIVGFKGLDQVQLAMDANMLVPLNEYKELLPNIFEGKEYADAVKYAMEYTSNGTGNLYMMPTAIGKASYNAFNWVPLLQWDTYKKIGMPKINTLEDYLDVVEKMVAAKPVNENGEKIYGFSLFSDWDKYTALEVSTLSYFYGIDTEYVSHLMETNVMTKEISSVLEEDSFYKRALKFYFDANQRGLLDPDSMTQTYSNVDAKYSAGRIMFSYFSWMTGSYNSPASGHVNNEEAPDGYASVVADDMKLYDAPDQTIGRNWYYAISKNCKDVERACEFLNWLYDPEINLYLMNGPEGLVWKYDDKGEPGVIDPEGWEISDKSTEPLMPEEIGGGSLRDGVYAFNTLPIAGGTPMDNGYTYSRGYWPTSLTRNPTLLKQEVNEFLGTNILAEYLEEKNMIAKSTQAVNMIPPISDELELIISQIGEIVKKYSWQMIFASSADEFESLWTQMVTEADGLGMEKIEAYYTQEWEKALEIVKDYE